MTFTLSAFQRRAMLLAAAASLALGLDTAQAQPVSPGKLTYGVAATFAPFEFSVDGKLTGFDIDFIEAIGKKMSIDPVPLNMDFGGLIPALLGKRIDIINSGMYINAARREQVDFVPYMKIGQQMVVRKGNPSAIAGRDDLCGRKVAVTLGGIQETYARQDAERCKTAGKSELTVMTLPTAQDSALSVRQGRADAYYESTAGVAKIVQERADVFEAVGPVFEFGTQVGVAVRKGDTAMAEAIATAIKAVVADGTYKALLAKYNFPADSSPFLTLMGPNPGALIWSYLVSPRFFQAASMTLLISLCSLLGGMLVGLLLALLQEARLRALRALAVAYLWLFRGTPVLFQLIFVFNVLPSFGLILSGFTCAILALSLNEGAYMAEIMRSGMRTVRSGQRNAARALGMADWQVMRWVILPQALRVVIPPIGNQFIGMLKLSALVSVIAVEELLLVANQTASSNFRYLESLSAAGIYYLAMTTVFMLLQSLVERALNRRRKDTALGLTRRLLNATAELGRVR